ncbi:Retinol dehydrogenase 12 [Nymphon striatum]|nr:Retinol dehydrogenase 12 [Nymphon striatum]
MNLSGKTAIVTGSNTGIGYETALDLYKKGAKVYIACRNKEKALKAIQKMESDGGTGELVYKQLDLARFAFCERFCRQYSTKGSRVVTLSSIAHRGATIDFDNFRLEKEYSNWREYGQSKLADIIFAIEFDKRLKQNGSQLKSLAAHPGFSKTDLQVHMDTDMLASLELMTAKEGAQPTLAACLREDAKGGQYWGPDGPNEQKGKPALAKIDEAALDETLNAKLWDWANATAKANFPF